MHIYFRMSGGGRVAELSVPQIVYPLGGSSKKGSHVYFLL